MKPLFGCLAIAITLASCSNDNALDFSGVDPALTVPPTQVMVLGTSHLSNYENKLSLEDLEPLLARLEDYAPDVITIESSSGMTCQRVRAYPLEHDGYAESYCFDSAPYLEESGLTAVEGSYQARKALLDWPDQPTAALRRSLAAAFIASGEPESALVQWFRLSPEDRVAGDGLGPKAVDLMARVSQRLNESYLIAA